MHKLRIKKKITKPHKVILPIFSEVAQSTQEKVAPQKQSAPEPQKSVSVAEAEPKNKETKPRIKRKILPSLSISIRPETEIIAEKEMGEIKEEKTLTLQNTPLTTENLNKAWEALRLTISDDKVTLKQCVKNSFPKVISSSEFSFTVSNKFQAESMRDNYHHVIPFLQETLENSQLKMKIEVSDKAESTVVFTSNDKFKRMLEKNPALEQLRKRLDLELD